MAKKPRNVLWDRFGGICHYCGEQCIRHGLAQGHPRQATIEHIVPRFFGGSNCQSNYVLACAECNNERGNQLFYCSCLMCGPKIQSALANDGFIDKMFLGIVAHNRPKVYRQDGKWMVRMYHGRKPFNSWEEAMANALAWEEKYGLRNA